MKKINLFLLGILCPMLVLAHQVIEKDYRIPVLLPDGSKIKIIAKVCHLESSKKLRVVLMNHGIPPKAEDRKRMRPFSCENEAVKWFLNHGYMVVSPLRRGYGENISSGLNKEQDWAESYGTCENPDFHKATLEIARDIQSSLDFLKEIPFADFENVAVVGQSAGGLGTIALNFMVGNSAKAYVNFSGGYGGHQGPQENQNCSPENLAKAVGRFSKKTNVPMLWLYTENDSYFPPKISISLKESYEKNGGQLKFFLKPPFGIDGHRFFLAEGGSKIWASDLEAYLNERFK